MVLLSGARRFNRFWMPNDPLPLLRLYLRLYGRVTSREFSDADPFGLIEIDPLEVSHVSNRVKDWTPKFGEVIGGDWDSRSIRIEEVPLIQVVTDYVNDEKPLDRPAYREYYAREHRRTVPFERRCEQVRNLVWDIEHHGYLSQRELLEDHSVYSLQRQNNDSIHPLLNEIRVDIDRDGRYHHWRCGIHRLSIARALGIPTVPVLVGTRHAEWQAVRDAFRRAGSAEALSPELHGYVGHPDLDGLLQESPQRTADSSLLE